MIYLLCRNRVVDFARWKAAFASHDVAHLSAGLRLITTWRGFEQPNTVFYVFEVANIDKARQFISNAEAAKRSETAGVIDSEYHFVEDAGGY